MALAMPTVGTADAAKVERSRKNITAFLEHQAAWITKAEDALQKGFAIETIGICIPQIHAMLRRGLWLQSQNHSLTLDSKTWKDDYLFDLLLDSRHDMMEGVQDQQLYGAAQKFDVIDETTASRLHRLYEDSKVTLRSTFSMNKLEKSHPSLEQIAGNFLKESRTCLENLEKQFKEFDQKISSFI